MKYFSLFFVLIGSLSFGQPGTLDSTFGVNGKVVTDFGATDDKAYSVVLQNDGKLVVGGTNGIYPTTDYEIIRYNLDGSLDNTFDFDGIVTTDFQNLTDECYSLSIQDDGRILAVGVSYNYPQCYFSLARYNIDGSLDITFGSGGKVLTAIGSKSNGGRSVAIQDDGKILVAGNSWDGSEKFALLRFNTDGSLDSAFDFDGTVTTDLSWQDIAYSVGLQSDGKIVVSGYSGYLFGLARFNSDGSLDSTFGFGGKVTTDFGSLENWSTSFSIQNDGKILLVGFSGGWLNCNFALCRYNADGTLDTTFGSGGKVITDFNGGDDGGNSVVIQPDGKILVGGYGSIGSKYEFALARYYNDGNLDYTFDSDGMVTTSIDGISDKGFSIALQADGRIVVAGFSYNGNNNDFALIRYNNNNSLTTTEEFIDNLSGIEIYPNPSSGFFNLKMEDVNMVKNICVYDLVGNCILNKECMNEKSLLIDLSNKSKGVYFVEIMSENGVSVKRISLQ